MLVGKAVGSEREPLADPSVSAAGFEAYSQDGIFIGERGQESVKRGGGTPRLR